MNRTKYVRAGFEPTPPRSERECAITTGLHDTACRNWIRLNHTKKVLRDINAKKKKGKRKFTGGARFRKHFPFRHMYDLQKVKYREHAEWKI